MKELAGFLEKYLKLTPPDDAVKRAVVEVIGNTFGIRIEKDTVRVHGANVFVNEDPHLKNMLVLHKEELLEKLKSILGTKAPKDIS